MKAVVMVAEGGGRRWWNKVERGGDRCGGMKG